MSEIPTIDVFRDGKHARINEADYEEWALRGWGVEVASPNPTPAPAPDPKPKPAVSPRPRPRRT